MKLVVCALLAVSSTSIELTTRDRIDQAIVSAESMDLLGSETILKRLLGDELTPDEKVSVLYNLASLACKQERYEEALGYFNQISQDLLEETGKVSPLTALAITYNHAICLIKLAEKTISDRSIDPYLVEAKKCLLQAKLLFSQVGPKDSTSTMLTHAFEVIASLDEQSKQIAFLKLVQSQSKQELLSFGKNELQALFSELRHLENWPDIQLYITDLGYRYQYKVLHFFDRVLVFLHAPSSPEIAKVRDFLIESILSAQSEFRKALDDKQLEPLVHSVYGMIQCVDLVAAEGVNTDIDALLQMRVKAFDQPTSLQKKTEKFTRAYLDKKISATKGLEQDLLVRLRKEIQMGPYSAILAKQHEQFWRLLNKPIDESYSELLKIQTKQQFEALIARLEVEKRDAAVPDLQKAMKAKDAEGLILTSWYQASPKSMLRYVVSLLVPKVKQRGLGNELQLLQRYLGDYAKKHPQFLPAFEELSKKNTAFDQYLSLFWLYSMLQDDPKNIKELSEAIKQMLVMQQDLFYASTNAPNSLPLGWRLQQSIAKQRASHLDKSGVSKSVLVKLTQIFSKIDLFLRGAPSKDSSRQVSDLLQQALKLLEQEEKTPSPTVKPEKRDLSLQMKKMPLQLAPETSIRLLQEMENEDASLFEKPHSEKAGKKPW